MSIFSKPTETSTKPSLPDLNLSLTLTLDPIRKNSEHCEMLVTDLLQQVWNTSLNLQVSFPKTSVDTASFRKFCLHISGNLNPTSIQTARYILDSIKLALFLDDSHPPIPTGRIFQGTLKSYNFDASFGELGIEYSVLISPNSNCASLPFSPGMLGSSPYTNQAGTSMMQQAKLFGTSPPQR